MDSKFDIEVYTDGSCHTQLLIGAWAAIIFVNEKKIILKGIDFNTTHNRMELAAVINTITWLDKDHNLKDKLITIYSDSQYAVNLITRKRKFIEKNFTTNKGTPIQNVDLVKKLLMQIDEHKIVFNKVKAHQKPTDKINYNREVDLIVRQLLRENVVAHVR